LRRDRAAEADVREDADAKKRVIATFINPVAP